MVRSAVALVLLVVFVALGFGWRTVLQMRRHGDSGWRFERSGVDRVVAPALAGGFLLLAVGPALAMRAGSAAEPWGLAGLVGTGAASSAAAVTGVTLVLVAGVLTLVAQVQMGASWRIGVREGERTALVTSGLFGLVRNPIFTGMLAFAAGLALLVPNAPTIVGAMVAVVAIHVQVRLVEEPNLVAVHGDAYRRWAATTGRFLPGTGRLDRGSHEPDGGLTTYGQGPARPGRDGAAGDGRSDRVQWERLGGR